MGGGGEQIRDLYGNGSTDLRSLGLVLPCEIMRNTSAATGKWSQDAVVLAPLQPYAVILTQLHCKEHQLD